VEDKEKGSVEAGLAEEEGRDEESEDYPTDGMQSDLYDDTIDDDEDDGLDDDYADEEDGEEDSDSDQDPEQLPDPKGLVSVPEEEEDMGYASTASEAATAIKVRAAQSPQQSPVHTSIMLMLLTTHNLYGGVCHLLLTIKTGSGTATHNLNSSAAGLKWGISNLYGCP